MRSYSDGAAEINIETRSAEIPHLCLVVLLGSGAAGEVVESPSMDGGPVETSTILWWAFVLSIGTFVGSILSLPWLVTRLPKDYFTRRRRHPAGTMKRHPVVRFTLVVLKNGAGLLLFVAGIAMLVLPGQGLLTIFMGMLLMDFPGKYRLERYLISRPAILRPLNWLRKRRGHEPLEVRAVGGTGREK